MNQESLKNKCKRLQELADYRLLPNTYIIFHLDGKNFSKFCKQFDKPFDDRFISMMNDTAKYLCENIEHIKFAYVQSDEISLLYNINDSPWFDNRICKLCSIAASLATSKFISLMPLYGMDIKLVQFDCKVWNVPNINDAYAWFLFRQLDCIRNSKQMAAQTYLPYNKLLHKTTDEQIALLKQEKNIDWSFYPGDKKIGRMAFKKETAIETEHGNVIRNKWNICSSIDFRIDKEQFFSYVNE